MSMFSMFFGDGGKYEAKRRSTIQAGELFKSSYEAYGTNRTQIAEQFAGNVSSARARMGASGANIEGPVWQGILGNLTLGRDEALASVQADEDAFKEGTAYRLTQEDFNRMGSVSKSRATGKDMVGGGVYTLNPDSTMTGESYFTDEQKDMLITTSMSSGLYGYANDLKPTFEEYAKFRFGSDEEKAAFSDSMTSRIEASNLKFEKDEAIKRAIKIKQSDFYRDGGRK